MVRTKKNHKWTHDLDEVVRLHYPTMQNAKLAQLMSLHITTITNRAFQLGLKKDTEYLKNIRLQTYRTLVESGKAYRFAKGSTPTNKGQKMSNEIREKIRASLIGHKRNKPKPIGYERKSALGYIDVKVNETQFVGKHRLLWEQANGQVPPGHVIIFADGNKRNFDLDNLVCVPRADVMVLNQNKKYGKEIAESALYLSKIKTIISNKN